MPDRQKPFTGPVILVGPYPPTRGGTATVLSRLHLSLAADGVRSRVFDTLRGDASRGPAERIRRLLFFIGVAIRVGLQPEKLVHCHAASWWNLVGVGFVRANHSDGDSLAVREAIEVGVPVVASRVGYRPPGVRLFEPGDPTDLASQVVAVLADGGDRDPDAAVQHEREVGLKNIRSLIQLYRRTLERG